MPFFGTVSVGYLPNKKILGLSKVARLEAIKLILYELSIQKITNIFFFKESLKCFVDVYKVTIAKKINPDFDFISSINRDCCKSSRETD